MNSKRVLVIYIFFSLCHLFSENLDLELPIQDWQVKKTYTNKTFQMDIITAHRKNILEKTIIIPQYLQGQILYLNIKGHSGYSKIYFNNNLLTTIGTIYQINEKKSNVIEIVPIPSIFRNTLELNTIKIVNYSNNDISDTEYFINTQKIQKWYNTFFYRMKRVLPLSCSIIVLFILVTFLRFKDTKEDSSNKSYIIALILFFSYFIILNIDDGNILKEKSRYFSHIVSISAWISFIMYYIIKYYKWDSKKLTIVTLISTVTILSFSIAYEFLFVPIDEIIYRLQIISINILFLYLLLKKPIISMTSFKLGLIYGLGLNIIGFILRVFYQFPDYGLTNIATIIILLGYYLTFFNSIETQIETNRKYNDKLLDSVKKGELELEKKEKQISKLKNLNDDITKEKSLLFTTLGKNLRAPLNSIIGYSENLYSTDNLDEVTPLVSEILEEADKIFQSINNIIEFSNKNVNNDDLLLKDFRMKEIFENAVYSSPRIKDFKNNINYKALDVSDKVILKGNPLIYKTMITNILQFLISLSPGTIDYSISNSGISNSYMDIITTFSATNLKNSNLSLVTPSIIKKEVFTKYIKLYNVNITEECTDNSYIIQLKYQCGLSKEGNVINSFNKTQDQGLDKNISVLVVEDYLPNLNIVKMHLTKIGCNVLTATNGEDAIAIFKNNIVDVILMDIEMPIMNGWEATEAIRSTAKGLDTLIIGLTASSLELDMRHCFESGMDDVQVKPIRKNQLYSKLKSLDSFKPSIFPSISSLRADYGISKLENETLFVSTINQIEKQLEVLDILVSAADDSGVKKEIPALIQASFIINAFYFSRLLRNFNSAYFNGEKERVKLLHSRLIAIVNIVKEENEILFRD